MVESSVVADGPVHRTVHEIEVAAPAVELYRLVADVTRWPVLFGPTIHIEHLERKDTSERFRIWATAQDEVKTWESWRELDSASRTVRFQQEATQPPIASMAGGWRIDPLPSGGSKVLFHHEYRAVDDSRAGLAWIDETVDVNSRAELLGLRAAAERGRLLSDLMVSFSDSVQIGGPLDAAYDFIYRAQDWPDRLPHVARMTLTEDKPGVQLMEMETRTADGGRHTTRSVRICFVNHKIVYKQLVPPALLSAHTGEWSFAPNAGGVRVTSQHTVVVNQEAIPAVVGAAATVADGKEFARNALSRNSQLTLSYAKDAVEAVSMN